MEPNYTRSTATHMEWSSPAPASSPCAYAQTFANNLRLQMPEVQRRKWGRSGHLFGLAETNQINVILLGAPRV